jgi:hypothetical protein
MMSYGAGGRSTMASKILCFLVESGTLYIFIGVSFFTSAHTCKPRPASIHKNIFQVIVLVSVFIHLSFATLGDILLPVGVQLAVRTKSFLTIDLPTRNFCVDST